MSFQKDKKIRAPHKISNIDKLSKELNLKQLQINNLLNITQAINNNVTATELYSMYQSFLSWEMGIKRMALFIKDSDTNTYECVSHHGIDDFIFHFDISPFIEEFDKMKYVFNHKNEILSKFDVVIPVFHKNQSLALSLIGGTADDANIIEKLQFIITITNIIAVAIENKRLFKRHIDQEILKNEMIFATRMQKRLIPSEFPSDNLIDIHGYYEPKMEVGGDYYDFVVLSEEEVALCIADISGKGVAAALLMSNIQAILRTLLKHFSNIIDILEEINNTINTMMEGDKFASMFLAKYNLKTRELKYINAGHNPPLLMEGKKSIELEANCSFLGSTMDLPEMKVQSIHLAKGALLLMYTDGLTEISNENEEDFSLEKIEKILELNIDRKAFNINEEIVREAKDFAFKDDLLDDLTLLTCKF